jgi:hypothetical protein
VFPGGLLAIYKHNMVLSKRNFPNSCLVGLHSAFSERYLNELAEFLPDVRNKDLKQHYLLPTPIAPSK